MCAACAARNRFRGGAEKTVHVFHGGADGIAPRAQLIEGNDGIFYGTTAGGGGGGAGCNDGNEGCSAVIKLTAHGQETVLYALSGGSDGAYPLSNMVMDASGNLYSTTEEGGTSNRGTAFKLAPDGTEAVLYDFSYGSDGFYPLAGLIEDGAGNLYGTTSVGGNASCHGGGCGTVFELSAKDKETVLYAFRDKHGRDPATAGQLLGPHGELYGTTSAGGKDNSGVVFELKNSGNKIW